MAPAGPGSCHSRPHPYTLSSADFATLHPEEATWVTQRLQVRISDTTGFAEDLDPRPEA
jgi:hypothetical protein